MFRKIYLTIFYITAVSLPDFVFAQTGSGSGASGGSGSGSGGSSYSSGGTVGLMNPLKNDTLTGLLQDILDVLMVFAIPLIVLFIIFAGFKYVMARGNPGEIATANKALLYAVIGGVIILGANIILDVIAGTISQF